MSQYEPNALQILAHRIDVKKTEVQDMEALYRMLGKTYGHKLPDEAADRALLDLL